jgi:hypothetical protein
LLAAFAILSLVAAVDFVGFLGRNILADPAYVLMGIALAWMGWTLWSGKSGAVGRAQPAL